MKNVKLYDKFGNEIEHLTRWDLNVTVQIHDFNYEIAPICHFATRYDDKSMTVTAQLTGDVASVEVPNILLTETETINMFVFLYDEESDSGRTLYAINIPVHDKPKPDDYEYSDNYDIVQISVLKAEIEAFLAEAKIMVDVMLKELEDSYEMQVLEIKNAIHADVVRLNQEITENNAQLTEDITTARETLESDITTSRQTLESDITTSRETLEHDITTSNDELTEKIDNAVDTLLNGIQDGTPKGVFADVSELANKEEGIYLFINDQSPNNGYIYYWDGETLSDRLLYYAGMVINNNTITYEMLTDGLKKQAVETVQPYILLANSWDNGVQAINAAPYVPTANTKADMDIDSSTLLQLARIGCIGLYVATENNGLFAHVIGETPSMDVSVQLTLKEIV